MSRAGVGMRWEILPPGLPFVVCFFVKKPFFASSSALPSMLVHRNKGVVKMIGQAIQLHEQVIRRLADRPTLVEDFGFAGGRDRAPQD